MSFDENKFFHQAVLKICGNLDFEIALQECLVYLQSFMPADMFNLNYFDRGLGAIKTLAIVTPTEAKKVNIVTPLNDEARKVIYDHEDREFVPSYIVKTDAENPIRNCMLKAPWMLKEKSIIVMHLMVKEERLGNLVLFAKGRDQYKEKHLRLFSMLNEPFAIALSNALRYDELKRLKEIIDDDIRYLKNKFQVPTSDVIIGEQYGLKDVMLKAKKVAPQDSPVLLLGETGVGKENIATAIHTLSNRRKGPFIKVNCGAIPDTLIDSELFGHEKGAFTGAVDQKRGCFERADGGTIFLDEIAELPLQAQTRMLRVLQEKKILRVGGTREIDLDIRIIAATHQNLQEMVDKKLFRMDVWFRLHVFPIVIPPLRDRREDIPLFVDYFIKKKAKELQIAEAPELAPEAIGRLKAYSWPGNVRELENVIERALILRDHKPLTFNELVWMDDIERQSASTGPNSEVLNLDLMNSIHIRQALEKTKGRINGPHGAAQMLGLNPSTLRCRMRKLGIPFGRGIY